nr:MopE-related protein [Corallococcus exiguus]
MLGPTQVTPAQSRGLRILLSEAQGTAFRLLAESFAGNACDGVPSTKLLRFVEVPQGKVQNIQLDVSQSDEDGDGHPSIATGGTDCDDANADIHPGAAELCDGVDNNCVDGEADAPGMRTWFLDEDGDGYGVAVMACVEPTGRLADQGGDCDDMNASVHPGQSELRCDARDDNCDGAKDEGLPILTWYRDADGDGYGDVTQAVSDCAPPPGHAAIATDCDDTRADIRPDVAETKDLKDNNCNGAIDEWLYPGPRLSAGFQYNIALTTAGHAWVWGRGGTTSNATPTRILNLAGVAALDDGDSHSLALMQDGTVWAWGSNPEGQVGCGLQESQDVPAPVQGLENFTAIAAGVRHSLALKRDGTVWAWGNNDWGQLGDGTMTRRYTPVQVNGMTGVIAIAARDYKSVALRSDGTVWNLFSLGSGPTPSQVPGLTGVMAISSGINRDMGLKADGTVWVWDRFAGQVPQQVPTMTNVTAISGGGRHMLALKRDGTVWAWGDNNAGQLGDGTTTPHYTPVQVTGLTDVAAISAGGEHSIAVKQDGSVWGWGFNAYGLIDDSETDVLTPKQIAGPGAWSLTGH